MFMEVIQPRVGIELLGQLKITQPEFLTETFSQQARKFMIKQHKCFKIPNLHALDARKGKC